MSQSVPETAATREDGTSVIDPPLSPNTPALQARPGGTAIVPAASVSAAPPTLSTTPLNSEGLTPIPNFAPAPTNVKETSMEVDSGPPLKVRTDLSRQQELHILVQISKLRCPDDRTYGRTGEPEEDKWRQFSSDFFTALEEKIIPTGFGLTWEDLIDIVQPERWEDSSVDVQQSSQLALQRMRRLIQHTEGGDTGEVFSRAVDIKGREDLSLKQKHEIMDMVNSITTTDYRVIAQLLEERIVPPDFGLSLMDLSVLCHPNKWVAHDENTLRKANSAFRKIQGIIDDIEKGTNSDVNKKTWVFYHRDATDDPVAQGTNDDFPPQKSNCGLRAFHMEGHRSATTFLQTIYQGLEAEVFKFGKLTPNEETSVKEADQHLVSINEVLRNFNKDQTLPLDLGVVDHASLLGQWRMILSQYKNEDRQFSEKERHNLIRLCESRHYPRGWEQVPPVEDCKYKPVANYWSSVCASITELLHSWYAKCVEEGLPEAASHFSGKTQEFYAEFRKINLAYGQSAAANIPEVERIAELLAGLAESVKKKDREGFVEKQEFFRRCLEQGGYPSDWLPAEPDGSHWTSPGNSPSTEIATLTNNMAALTVASRRTVIAVHPRRCERGIKDGETSTGEKIQYIQLMGQNRANFVVASADGAYRLVDGGSAGGRPALNGAIRANVPYTIQDKDLKDLKERLLEGGRYGLDFVALGPWDLTPQANGSIRSLPHMVVGFFHKTGFNQVTAAMSRSNLEKLLSKTQAERLIVEVLTGNPEMTLWEALLGQVQVMLGGHPRGSGGFGAHAARPEQRRALPALHERESFMPNPRIGRRDISHQSQRISEKRPRRGVTHEPALLLPKKEKQSQRNQRAVQLLSKLLENYSSDEGDDNSENEEEEH